MVKGVQIIKNGLGSVLNVTELHDGFSIPVFAYGLSGDSKFRLLCCSRRMADVFGDGCFMGRFTRFMMCRNLKKRIKEIAAEVFNDSFNEHCGAELIPESFGRYGYGIMLSWRECPVPEQSFMTFTTALNQPEKSRYIVVKKNCTFDFRTVDESGETKKLYAVLVMFVRQ